MKKYYSSEPDTIFQDTKKHHRKENDRKRLRRFSKGMYALQKHRTRTWHETSLPDKTAEKSSVHVLGEAPNRSRRFIKGLCPSKRDENIIHQRTKYDKSPYFNTRHEPLMKLRASQRTTLQSKTQHHNTQQNNTAQDIKRGFGPAKGWMGLQAHNRTAQYRTSHYTTRQHRTEHHISLSQSRWLETRQHRKVHNRTLQERTSSRHGREKGWSPS